MDWHSTISIPERVLGDGQTKLSTLQNVLLFQNSRISVIILDTFNLGSHAKSELKKKTPKTEEGFDQEAPDLLLPPTCSATLLHERRGLEVWNHRVD